MSITDTLGNTEVFSLIETVNLISGSSGGIMTTVTGASINVLSVSGTGFGINFAGYAPPTAGTASTGLTGGNLSISVISTANPAAATPEPASIAMLGFGLISVAGYGLRRRMAK
jgi:hypothetical protein